MYCVYLRDDRRAALVSSLKAESIPLPAHWESVDPAHGNDSLVRLDSTNATHAAERGKVEANLKRTLPNATVHNVYRVQQPGVYRRYEAKKKELLAKGGQGDIIAYHGTRGANPRLIYRRDSIGFDPKFGRTQPGVSCAE
jgi:hypothetical protein